MTLAVDWDLKHQFRQTNKFIIILVNFLGNNVKFESLIFPHEVTCIYTQEATCITKGIVSVILSIFYCKSVEK